MQHTDFMTDLRVSELHREVNKVLNGIDVWVVGELSSYRRVGANVYAELIERAGARREIVSKVNLTLVGRNAVRVQAHYRNSEITLEPGVPVRVHGILQTYTPSGSFQVSVDDADPAWTHEQIIEDRTAVLGRLERDGLLARQKSLTLAAMPLQIGVVTSRGSAAEADMLTGFDCGIGFQVVVVDAVVQGPRAPQSVKDALVKLHTGLGSWVPDVVIVGRGGGSATDLSAFDSEELARVIARAPWPVITGIGHETDTSVCDHVAYRRAKTPTAAVEGLVKLVREHHAVTLNAAGETLRNMDQQLERTHRALDELPERVERDASRMLEMRERELLNFARGLQELPRVVLGQYENTLTAHERTLERRVTDWLNREGNKLDVAHATVDALNPEKIMERGWSITHHDGVLVRGPLPAGSVLETRVSGGTLVSVVR